MPATLPQTPLAPPACRWILPWTPPGPQYPAGGTGCLEITSHTKRGPVTAAYQVECVLDGGRIVGWELTNLSSDEIYHLDPYAWGWEQCECTCGSCVYRQKTCKHAISLKRSLQQLGVEL